MQAYPKIYNNKELHSKKTEINSLQQKLHHWCQMCEITWATTSFNKALSEKGKKKYILSDEKDINCWRIYLIKVWQSSHARVSRMNSTIKLPSKKKRQNEKEKLNHHMKKNNPKHYSKNQVYTIVNGIPGQFSLCRTCTCKTDLLHYPPLKGLE